MNIPRLIHRSLLILALLVGQWALLSHHFDLHAHDQGNACEICALSSPADQPLAADFALPSTPRTHAPAPLAATPPSTPPHPGLHPIRAPPARHHG